MEVMFGKHVTGWLKSRPVTGLYRDRGWDARLPLLRLPDHHRTSIMRAIKCLKSIRWMPWR